MEWNKIHNIAEELDTRGVIDYNDFLDTPLKDADKIVEMIQSRRHVDPKQKAKNRKANRAARKARRK